MFEAAAMIDVMDGTLPCFPFLAQDFKEIERTIMIRFIKNKYRLMFKFILLTYPSRVFWSDLHLIVYPACVSWEQAVTWLHLSD
jgi:hypothetical protein